ncbi:MAG TPA: ABC transporter substrate-binding protein [Chloroflexota bacterium]|nr:ABC transporter substrate-binding protein [Chloroflexota bacterium]
MLRSPIPFALSLVLVLAACGGTAPPAAPGASEKAAGSAGAQAGAPKMGGTIRVGLDSELANLDPMKSALVVDRQVMYNMYDSLVAIDKDLKIVPALADSWDQSDPATYVFHLRKGVKFHDGADFSAEAVKFSLDRNRNTDTSPRKAELSDVASVDVVDPATVKVTLKGPSAPFLATLVDRAGMIVSPDAVKKGGEDFTRNPAGGGTGAFKFVEWAKGDHITLEKNPNYWKSDASGNKLPYTDKVTYRFFPDQNVRLTNLKTGDQDVIYRLAEKDVADAKQNPDVVYKDAPGLAWAGLIFNTKRPPFDDKNVRLAVNYAIDRPQILKTVFFNVDAEAQNPMTPAISWAYDASVAKPFSHDVNKAKQLLSEAGKSNVSFTLDVSNNPQDIQEAQLIKDELAEAGMAVNLNVLEFTKQIDQASKHDFQVSQFGWSGRIDPDGEVYNHVHSTGGMNYGQYSNKELDDLLDKARRAQTQDERQQLYSQAMKILAQDAPRAWINFQPAWGLYTKKVQNYDFVGDAIIRLEGVWLR